MMSKYLEDNHQHICCPLCENENLTSTFQSEDIQYGSSGKSVTVDIPVFICPSCSFVFSGEEAETVIHDAICKDMGVLTPSEITEIRRKLGLSQEKFAELTKIGVASIKRWESGKTIQDASKDTYLRLLAIPEVMDKLERINNKAKQLPTKKEPKFRSQFSPATISRAENFQLRRLAA
ncbi:type II toxin-antitoxin system MqsA family antitoxin [Sneathiella sp. P13V-1]|uniref:type II TA system antitoxin MqsA family protein n=1 Tax=Sneathiella sp. P13V-1 TaxID=2697366 RepID=UPI00187BBDF1|nr:type II TA system antitoxin MqsA family protein [Sneathiella sp. P13V-1]MBE7635471.1 type II toxin-antitoxin system MqsA family antitoxin [Sneathiella sp. P13V-1]